MAMQEYKVLEKWALENIGMAWKAQLCREIGAAESIPAKLRMRKRLGLEMTIKIAEHTGLSILDLGYPELKAVLQGIRKC